MHPWITEQLGSEYRRELLASADRWRLLHRRTAGSAQPVRATAPAAPASDRSAHPAGSMAGSTTSSLLSWTRFGRRAERISTADSTASKVTAAPAR